LSLKKRKRRKKLRKKRRNLMMGLKIMRFVMSCM
jgi:hypothetical protein